MTPDPVRLLAQQDDTFATSLLRSAREGDATAARTHKAAVLGAAGGAAVGGTALAVAKLSSRGLWSALGGKWLAAGALLVAGGVGTGAAFLWSGEPASPPEAASVAPLPAPPSAAPSPPSLSSLAGAPRAPDPLPAPGAADPAVPADPGASDSDQASVDPEPPEPAAAPSSGGPSVKAPSLPRVAAAAPAAASTTRAPAAAGAALSDEVAALRGAHEALGRGQAQRCLDAVDAYFARFPQGRLSAEARFLRVQALAGAGRRAEAAALARSMLAGNPRSPYAARLRSIAGEDAAPRNP